MKTLQEQAEEYAKRYFEEPEVFGQEVKAAFLAGAKAQEAEQEQLAREAFWAGIKEVNNIEPTPIFVQHCWERWQRRKKGGK
jgi:hypothetical protein